MSFESDESIAAELSIYLENDPSIYRKMQFIAKNLLRKIKNGSYVHSKAPQAWSYAVEDAAKMYAKEFGNARDWPKIFPPKIRRLVAEELAGRWYANAKAGRPDEV